MVTVVILFMVTVAVTDVVSACGCVWGCFYFVRVGCDILGWYFLVCPLLGPHSGKSVVFGIKKFFAVGLKEVSWRGRFIDTHV